MTAFDLFDIFCDALVQYESENNVYYKNAAGAGELSNTIITIQSNDKMFNEIGNQLSDFRSDDTRVIQVTYAGYIFKIELA